MAAADRAGFLTLYFSKPRQHSDLPEAVRKSWTTALKQAKIDLFLICNLRATFASRLSAAGAPDNLVVGMIGHSLPGIVQTYARVVDEYRREAIRKLEAFRQSHLPCPVNTQDEKVAQ